LPSFLPSALPVWCAAEPRVRLMFGGALSDNKNPLLFLEEVLFIKHTLAVSTIKNFITSHDH